jgi:8-amino-7-oxononanoate synthase
MFQQHLTQKLKDRQTAGLLRTRQLVELHGATMLVAGKSYINFSGNDYLGLAQDSTAITETKTGAIASPLVVGRHAIHQELESELLDWVKAPKTHGCLLFSSGFAANTGVISALFNEKSKDAFLLQDKLNHASLIDAGKHAQALGHVRQLRFAHNHVEDLNNKLTAKAKTSSNSLVVTEGVFSMDGDSPNLAEMRKVSSEYNSLFMLDDAHGIGVNGPNGEGTFASQRTVLTESDVLVVTFGKAIGAQGAAVIADSNVIEYLVNFSREYIYSTHLSPLQTQAVINNIKKAKVDHWRREKLQENIAYFRTEMAKTDFQLMPSNSSIQPILIGDELLAVSLSDELKKGGFWLGAMRYPTVAKGQARLRATITAQHTKEHIELLINNLQQYASDHKGAL